MTAVQMLSVQCAYASYRICVAEQEDALQRLDTQRLELPSVKLNKRLCWVHHRLDSIVEDIWNGLLLLG